MTASKPGGRAKVPGMKSRKGTSNIAPSVKKLEKMGFTAGQIRQMILTRRKGRLIGIEEIIKAKSFENLAVGRTARRAMLKLKNDVESAKKSIAGLEDSTKRSDVRTNLRKIADPNFNRVLVHIITQRDIVTNKEFPLTERLEAADALMVRDPHVKVASGIGDEIRKLVFDNANSPYASAIIKERFTAK